MPLLNAMHAWMVETVSQLDNKSDLASAFNYSLNRWEALCRYTQDGRLEIDNTIAERSIRGMGIGRRNFLFFGSDSGGERAAIIYSLVERENQITSIHSVTGTMSSSESPIIRSIASRNCCRGILSINCKNPRKSRMRWRLKSAGSTPLVPPPHTHSHENDEHFL